MVVKSNGLGLGCLHWIIARVLGTGLLAAVCLMPVSARNGTSAAKAGGGPNAIQPGTDAWETPAGQTHHDFSSSPIPADFFFPGSEPFDGVVQLRGQPLDEALFGTADTMVNRQGTAPIDGPGTQGTVPIQIVALSLQSVQPIMVANLTGAELFDVRVDLSVQPQIQGQMTNCRLRPC